MMSPSRADEKEALLNGGEDPEEELAPRLLPMWMDAQCAYCDERAKFHDPRRAGELVCRDHLWGRE